MRKRILPLSINETLNPNTTYRVVIAEKWRPIQLILGEDRVIEFTTEVTSVSPKGEEKLRLLTKLFLLVEEPSVKAALP